MRIWIFSPVFKDAVSYKILRTKIREILNGYDLKFVVIDDSGGQDLPTLELASLKDTNIITPPFNLGHQRALVFGLRHFAHHILDEDIIVTMDADGEDRPEDIPLLLKVLLEDKGKKKIALAKRGKRRESLFFKISYFFFKNIFKILTGAIIESGNFAAYRGALVHNVIQHPHFDLCYSSSLVSLPLPADFIICDRGQRYAGRSHMNFSRLVMHGLRMHMPFMDRIAVRALIVLTSFLAGALALTLIKIFVNILLGQSVPFWAIATLILWPIVALNAAIGFIALFSIYTQSQGLALRVLDEKKSSSNFDKVA